MKRLFDIAFVLSALSGLLIMIDGLIELEDENALLKKNILTPKQFSFEGKTMRCFDFSHREE